MRHLFPYKWALADGYPSKGIEANGLNVFGTFTCGGGSTMGYKLAGYNHLGGVEIDPRMAKVYAANHYPLYAYTEDIRTFRVRDDLPKKLFSLDILDGSPPCSSFSMSGNREKDWGKQKVFREGQASQTLDDLFFEYIALVDKLRPKVVIAENVTGLLRGNGKVYVGRILEAFKAIGYKVQLFSLDASTMGVPQRRQRVFFIASREDLNFKDINMDFKEPPIPFGCIKELDGVGEEDITDFVQSILKFRKRGDKSLADTYMRMAGKGHYFTTPWVYTDKVVGTLITSPSSLHILFDDLRKLSANELKSAGTFPTDYNFLEEKPQYVIGMSVPPVMTAQVALRIAKTWF